LEDGGGTIIKTERGGEKRRLLKGGQNNEVEGAREKE
jgi:hypothetical protein